MKILLVNNRTIEAHDRAVVGRMGIEIVEYDQEKNLEFDTFDHIFIFNADKNSNCDPLLKKMEVSHPERISHVCTAKSKNHMEGIIDITESNYALMHIMFQYLGLSTSDKGFTFVIQTLPTVQEKWVFILLGETFTNSSEFHILEGYIEHTSVHQVVLICEREEDAQGVRLIQDPRVHIAPFFYDKKKYKKSEASLLEK